jgi:hypothetical protein
MTIPSQSSLLDLFTPGLQMIFFVEIFIGDFVKPLDVEGSSYDLSLEDVYLLF